MTETSAGGRGCTLCAGKVTNQDQPHEVIREGLILLIGQTRKATVSRLRRPAPSHVASQGRAEAQTRAPDPKASSVSTTLHCLWALAFPGPTAFQISKIKQDFGFQISTPWLTVLLSPLLGAWDLWASQSILPRLQHSWMWVLCSGSPLPRGQNGFHRHHSVFL